MNNLRTVIAVMVLTASVILAACTGGAAAPAELTPGPATTDLHIVAKSARFDSRALAVPANSEVAVTLDNKDSLPHNIAIYRDKSAKEKLFAGDVVDGRESGGDSFRSPAAGVYYFRCDLHTNMNGTLFVQ